MKKLCREKENDIVIANRKLVYWQIKKMGISPSNWEYDDIVEEGMIGLIKAARSFDETKQYAFSTYAIRCIYNEILMFLDKQKRHNNVLSMDKPINDIANSYGSEITIADTIEDPDSDFSLKLEEKEEYRCIIEDILNILTVKERTVLLYRIANLTQIQIAKLMNINQGYISRLERKGIRKIKDIVLNQVQYKKKYRFEINKNEYIFSALKKQISEDRLKEIISKNHSLKIELTNEWIYIHLNASPKSFIKISQLIQEIDEIKL